MIVYRVEDSKGLGPYRHRTLGDDIDDILDGHSCCDKHPHPTRDAGLEHFDMWSLTGRHRFGFKSLRDLRNWFDDGCLDLLRNYGYRVVAYDVNRAWVDVGGYQVVFMTTGIRRRYHNLGIIHNQWLKKVLTLP